ncbi:MAG: hypothetical protein GY929_15965 [Actinomycetia bacterium]|nr:hypothetical protein [Actinomycetes bacterium]
MKLDLRRMPISVINLTSASRRRAFMHDQLETLGLEHRFVPAVECEPPGLGCTLSHLKTLSLLAARPPFLILEDDCQLLLEDHPLQFDVPDDTDALYLGHSSFGLTDGPDQFGLRWGQDNNVRYEDLDDEYIRVLNMLSAHAIIFISEECVRSAIDANTRALLNHDFPYAGDMAYAELQERLKVLATRQPLCYQSAGYDGNEGSTRRSIVKDSN